MPCDSQPRRNQSLSARKQEVEAAVSRLDRLLLSRKVRPVVDRKTGAVAFSGWSEQDRAGITDACAYRRLLSTGSALAKAEIARAEQLAGRTISRDALVQGVHSHDGGRTWGKD